MNNIYKLLPKMMTGDELIKGLSVLPEYDESICFENPAVRLMTLSNIHNIYIPSEMTTEIYSKLYLSLLHSLQKKTTKAAVIQRNLNYKGIKSHKYSGIIGGSDSFTIIGKSGIGKSSAISRSIDLIMQNGIIESCHYYTTIIPCLVVQCPFDSSVKGLLLEILRKVDEALGSEYYKNALKLHVTTDMLIGSVSQIAINHIGLLIVDEIQNVVNSKNGKSLVGMLTQLINNSGISICMVGTPESNKFFEQEMQLARRSLGLQYGGLLYDDKFHNLCRTLFKYQYTRERSEISDVITNWLYEHSGGVVSTVVSLIHDAQEIAILNGTEKLDISTLTEAYNKRLNMLHGFIESRKRLLPTNKMQIKETEVIKDVAINFQIKDIVLSAKTKNENPITMLKETFTIEEISL